LISAHGFVETVASGQRQDASSLALVGENVAVLGGPRSVKPGLVVSMTGEDTTLAGQHARRQG
jgi:hypothetical protein